MSDRLNENVTDSEMKPVFITADYVRRILKPRNTEAHKGDFGKILIIAGTKGMAGAAVMCARAALRSGAGLVKVSIPEELFPIVQISVPEAICVGRNLTKEDFEEYDAIAIGPGLGTDEESARLLEKVLDDYEKTLVLDADALNIVAKKGNHELLKRSRAKTIITPHLGEAKRLMGMVKYQPVNSRERLAEELVNLTESVSVLKGAGTVVAAKDHPSYINTTGNPGMATGGSGDVLTGMITAFAGQGIEPFDAAKTAVFLHGMAGDMSCEAFGEYGMTALDIADMCALAIKRVLQNQTAEK
ncbi:MAG: NAD(P)H-hydrate dehydratase [Clostridia bacterium]|nr:NAD(P)H-hydrate dehydratase [Clostridia bacterium]